MRTCAVCSKPITRSDLCTKCWKEWTNNGDFYPAWLKAIVKMQSSFEKNYAATEIPFSNYYKHGEPE